MAGQYDSALGLYVSIPFCRSKCTYCNFASGVYPARDHERYVSRLIEDLSAAPAWAAHMGVELPHRVDSIYFGGGTPTLLAPHLLTRLLQTIRARFDLLPDAEITVECAPGQLPDETLEALVSARINRISLGVQSFLDAEAHSSGRLHNRHTVASDLSRLRAAGVSNLNVDLIAGLAGQTLASWDASLSALVDSAVPHASIYMLEVDEDSRLGREMFAGGSRYHAALVPDDEVIAQMYARAIDRLAAAGLVQYEISNFSRPGFESRHNLRYWRRRPYLGLGLDASSMLRALPQHDPTPPGDPYVLRSTTTDNLQSYLEAAEPPEIAWLSPARQHEEAWFLGLRLNAGVEIEALEREFGAARVAPAIPTAARLADEGFLQFAGRTARLTPQGRLFSNDVFQQFLEESVGPPRRLDDPQPLRQSEEVPHAQPA